MVPNADKKRSAGAENERPNHHLPNVKLLFETNECAQYYPKRFEPSPKRGAKVISDISKGPKATH